MSVFVITYDIGTTGIKTCIFDLSQSVQLIASEMACYKLYIDENGGAEQDPEEIWQAMCTTTKRVLEISGLDPQDVSGISFCSQMQGLVLVDHAGEPIRRIMSYMDQRAHREMKKGIVHGFKISGLNAKKLFKEFSSLS